LQLPPAAQAEVVAAVEVEEAVEAPVAPYLLIVHRKHRNIAARD
jgi:hypothetical protein